MIEAAAATQVIGLVSSSVTLIDKIYDSWQKYVGTKKAEKSEVTTYYEKITTSKDGKALVHSVDGRVSQTVTISQLKAQLAPTDVDYISALEVRMNANVKKWNAIVRNMALETDPAREAILEIKLDNLKVKIAEDCTGILGFSQQLGFCLQDHYGAARAIAAKVTSSAAAQVS